MWFNLPILSIFSAVVFSHELKITAATVGLGFRNTDGNNGSSGSSNGSSRDNEKKGPCYGSTELYENHPVLCKMLDRVEDDIGGVLKMIDDFARENHLLVGNDLEWGEGFSEGATITRTNTNTTIISSNTLKQKHDGQQLPVVFAHGMGDSCFNSGMINIGKHTSSLLDDVYVTCIPTGDTKSEDTTNGYFLNMDASVDVFFSKISQDPNLKNGFHAIGFSQGNNVIRGYIARYNNPTVHTFISINGVNAGEGTVPGCFPNNHNDVLREKDENIELSSKERVGGVCDLLLEQASRKAYTNFAQTHSFQANYWRDPREKEEDAYHAFSQLARWNNEGPNNKNQTLIENYLKTSKFVWIMATEDSMVWPKEGEHWGCPDKNNPFQNRILSMNETIWYIHDLFGLKTAQRQGKNFFETFVGDHLRFSMDEFDRWITTYIKSRADFKNGEEHGSDKIHVANIDYITNKNGLLIEGNIVD